MRNALPIVTLSIVALFASACQSNTRQSPPEPGNGPAIATQHNQKPVAYLDGKPVTQEQVYRRIVAAHGGEALAEILLDRAVQQRLEQEQINLKPADLEAERLKLLASLDRDPDQAARLLREMRGQRGLDEKRFAALLRRNAGLRALVRDAVQINDAAIGQAYDLRYGPRYRVRLIVTDGLGELNRIRKQALGGASVIDLAIQHSTDASAAQGGLLSPISPADPTYPKAIRDALPKLTLDNTASRLSPAIALDTGYALLWLEDIISKDAPPMHTVRAELEAAVREDLERLRMRQLARTLIEQTNVVVLEPLLGKAWKQQRNTVNQP